MKTKTEIKIEIEKRKAELKTIQEAIDNKTEEWYMLEQMEDAAYTIEAEIKLLEWVIN